MEQRNLEGEVVCNLIFSATTFKRRHYTEIFQRDFYNIVIIRFSLFIYLFKIFFSNSETIMNFTLSNIIGSTVDPRPQDDVLQKNVTVILRYKEVSPLDCKLIYNCDKKKLPIKKNMLTSLATKGLIDNCFYCFRIFLFFSL